MRAIAAIIALGGLALGLAVLAVPVLPMSLADGADGTAAAVVAMMQHAALLALAAFAGARLAPTTGLRSHVAGIGRPWCAREVGVALLVGVAIAMGSFLLRLAAGDSVAPATVGPRHALRLALGLAALDGVYHEILLRWGALNVVLWLVLVLRRRAGPADARERLIAVVLVALLVGAAFAGRGASDAAWALHLAGTVMPAVAYGWVAARWSLEAAMIAHVIPHLLGAFAVGAGLLVAG